MKQSSFGVRPAGFRLPDATRLGAVRLQVSDIERSLVFYQRTLGLRVLHKVENIVRDEMNAAAPASSPTPAITTPPLS